LISQDGAAANALAGVLQSGGDTAAAIMPDGPGALERISREAPDAVFVHNPESSSALTALRADPDFQLHYGFRMEPVPGIDPGWACFDRVAQEDRASFVLVVALTPGVVSAYTAALEGAGHVVVSAHAVQTGWSLIATHRPDHILLEDVTTRLSTLEALVVASRNYLRDTSPVSLEGLPQMRHFVLNSVTSGAPVPLPLSLRPHADRVLSGSSDAL
jgi:CheY-like chemotaxis protein